jgi:hypothetical protein
MLERNRGARRDRTHHKKAQRAGADIREALTEIEAGGYRYDYWPVTKGTRTVYQGGFVWTEPCEATREERRKIYAENLVNEGRIFRWRHRRGVACCECYDPRTAKGNLCEWCYSRVARKAFRNHARLDDDLALYEESGLYWEWREPWKEDGPSSLPWYEDAQDRWRYCCVTCAPHRCHGWLVGEVLAAPPLSGWLHGVKTL